MISKFLKALKANYYKWPSRTWCYSRGFHMLGLIWAQIPRQTLKSEPRGLSRLRETSRTALVRWSRLESYQFLVNEGTHQEGVFFRLLCIFTGQAAGKVYSPHLMAWFLVSEVERRESWLSSLRFEHSCIGQATSVELLKRRERKPPKHLSSFEKSNSRHFLWLVYGIHTLVSAPILQASSKTLKTCTVWRIPRCSSLLKTMLWFLSSR